MRARLIGQLRRAMPAAAPFLRETGGVAVIEFALVFPVMLLLYIGIVDVSRGVIATRKLDVLARTAADLISQQSTNNTVSSQTMSTIFTASSALMQPFDPTGATITLSAVAIQKKSNNTCCDALVQWSYTQGGTLRACGTPLLQVANGTRAAPNNIPAALVTANQNAGFDYSTQTSYVIIADVTYRYVPIFYQALTWFAPGMAKTMYMVPRASSGTITLSTPLSPASNQSAQTC